MFNIETYLDSLPENTEEIDVSHRSINHLPDLTVFTKLNTLHCDYNNLTSLPPLPVGLKILYCGNNKLTYLPNLPENLELLYCDSNRLFSLPPLPKKLEKINCYCNKLSSLPPLNEQLKTFVCTWNNLSYLPNLPKNLEVLYCDFNKLTSLPNLPENFKILRCSDNELSCLQLNEKLEKLDYRCNPIYEIINTKDINVIKEKLKILNRFRYLYYCLKFKKRFRDLLWVKIREPTIRKKYSHEYLVEHLHEETDLDELLNNW